jgi:hypothetical protein
VIVVHTVDPWSDDDEAEIRSLEAIGTDELLNALRIVGDKCTRLDKELQDARRERLRVMIVLEQRGVGYSEMGRLTKMSHVAVLRGLQRHHERLDPEPVI